MQQADPAVAAAFAEARKRFPASVSLGSLEADHNRRQGNFEVAAAALQHLAEIDPQQKINWLSSLARVRQDQGNMAEALKVAEQIIAASPASPVGHLLYAELAFATGKNDDGVARLKAAVKISERPNAGARAV